MDKMSLSTPDITQENVEKIAALFPDAVTEIQDADGQLRHAIDFDALKNDLGAAAADGTRERYQFTWPGKRAAKLEAREPFDGTLRPCKSKSKNWDTTQNVYIEGDNLQALKLMRETYAGKVKMIYIDPPYNTGHDFIYDDDFAQSREDYVAESGDYDAEGGALVANPESNGRFHSDWCSMIYPRLLLSRDLLTVDGVLAISISDQELASLIKICSEIFSGKTVMPITVQTSGGKPNSGFNVTHEYVVFVAPRDFAPIPFEEDRKAYSSPYHSMTLATFNQVERPNQAYPIFVDNAGRIVGVGHSLQQMLDLGEISGPVGDYIYDFSVAPAGTVAVWPISTKNEQCVWRLIPERLMHDWAKGYVKVVPQQSKANPNAYGIQYLSGGIISKIESGELETYKCSDDQGIPTIEVKDYKTAAATIPTLWTDKCFYTAQGKAQIKDLFGKNVFSYPKPVDLIFNIVKRVLESGSLLMDFFSGSAATANALMKLNAEDDENRHFIMVQLPEECDKDTEAYKAGYRTICDIGEERIRRAGDAIKAEVEKENAQPNLEGELKKVPDIGFRVFRIDSSNFVDTRRTPDQVMQNDVKLAIDNLKTDRTDEDLLFQVLPMLRIPYSAVIEVCDKGEMHGKTVYAVNGNQLLACFDKKVGVDTIEAIAKRKPYYAVFRDASFADDATAANFEELFKTFSPDTIRKVI